MYKILPSLLFSFLLYELNLIRPDFRPDSRRLCCIVRIVTSYLDPFTLSETRRNFTHHQAAYGLYSRNIMHCYHCCQESIISLYFVSLVPNKSVHLVEGFIVVDLVCLIGLFFTCFIFPIRTKRFGFRESLLRCRHHNEIIR